MDNMIDDDLPNYNHQCYICDKIFSANSNLNRHLRKIHKENVQSPYNNVKCALCDSLYSSSSIYNNHLEREHQVKIEIESLDFPNKTAFEDWKHSIETETTSQFIKSRGEKKTKNVNKTYFSCNRSGYYVSKARTRKALKKQGSRKINGRCPASMNVTVNPDSSYNVRFVKTHVGHEFELKHLDLSDKDRDLIVQKLASGVTKKEIIKQIRSAIEQQQLHHTQSNASMSPASSVSGNATIQPIIIGGRDSSCSDQIELIAVRDEVIIANSASIPISTSTSASTPTSSTTPIPSNSSNSFTNATNSGSNNDSSSNCILNVIQQQPTSRLHLATTKDLHNILNSKHLDPKKIRHNYDLNNVEAWINEMNEYGEESSVLFYKNQNEKSEKFPQLTKDDFIIIVMTDAQSSILKEFGNKSIIIDSTHNVHCEYLQVTYVSVIDEERRSFPAAFMFSTRTNLDTLEVFFTVIKVKVGMITTRMFIADELHDFYQAWWKVMSMPVHNLLTPWSVFEAWSKRFDLVPSREKLRKLKKQLRSILTETETDKFSKLMKQMLVEQKADEDVSKFIEYFETNYSRNPDIWSNCLRKTYDVSNQQLWNLHEKFKSVYKEGKNSKKLCKYISGLMSLYEESQLDRLARLADSNELKRQALAQRHKKSFESSSLLYEVAVEPVYWLCPSQSSSEVYYEVKKVSSTGTNSARHNDNASALNTSRCNNNSSRASKPNSGPGRPLESSGERVKETEKKPRQELTSVETKKCCDLQCPDCKTCRHEFKCTCLDYVVNWNMCKHIHRIRSMSKQIDSNNHLDH